MLAYFDLFLYCTSVIYRTVHHPKFRCTSCHRYFKTVVTVNSAVCHACTLRVTSITSRGRAVPNSKVNNWIGYYYYY